MSEVISFIVALGAAAAYWMLYPYLLSGSEKWRTSPFAYRFYRVSGTLFLAYAVKSFISS